MRDRRQVGRGRQQRPYRDGSEATKTEEERRGKEKRGGGEANSAKGRCAGPPPPGQSQDDGSPRQEVASF